MNETRKRNKRGDEDDDDDDFDDDDDDDNDDSGSGNQKSPSGGRTGEKGEKSGSAPSRRTTNTNDRRRADDPTGQPTSRANEATGATEKEREREGERDDAVRISRRTGKSRDEDHRAARAVTWTGRLTGHSDSA